MNTTRTAVLARALAADDSADAADPTTGRILDAARDQFSTFGVRRSTVEDVARRARVGRVTVYRRFDTKNALVEAVLIREARRFLAVFDAEVAALPTMEERIVAGFVVALRDARTSLIGRLLELEPETALPFLTTRGGPILGVLRDYLAASFVRAPDATALRGPGDPAEFHTEDGARVAEIFVRLTVSFLLTPQSIVPLDDEPRAREFARRFLAPMVTGPPAQ
ncbi:TetR/AcrR family transcriptional regulator [Yinghuangia seranimata]|uniref:TetR/AcrR family transcriptional regulator n=1 Tax=Yinghuangia seranimata TaxID=408067 RepID=UPI00248B8E9B|nr:TetR family transcriptional regulator [Yinghuangia seranimata]MDI2127232.1 TetR family transcriptional regulator [Yinghuangia seranimata]